MRFLAFVLMLGLSACALPGPKGDPGPQGERGEQGPTGAVDPQTSLDISTLQERASNLEIKISELEPQVGEIAALKLRLEKAEGLLQDRIQSDYQIRLSIADLYEKWQAQGPINVNIDEIVKQVIAKIPPSTVAPAIVDGDLRVTGRICVGDAGCIADAGEQIQIAANNGAGVLFRANLNGKWYQNSKPGVGSIGMSPDLGLRLIQNQRWTTNGTHIPHIVPEYPTGAVGFDSQAQWSWNWHKPGQPDHGTQQLVLLSDEDTREVYFAMWRPGWRLGVRTSFEKWDQLYRYTVPRE